MLSTFVKHIEENIYHRELIYRSILVVKSKLEGLNLHNLLEYKDYTSHFVEDISDTLDYNDIDCRIMIVSTDKFKDFIQHIDNTVGINNSSYNFIGFNYTINDEWVNEMISYYIDKTKNNYKNTIIMDKKYYGRLLILANV